MGQAKYEVLARWRNGWELIRHPGSGQHYLRRAFRGTYKVSAVKSGFATWTIHDEAGERVSPEYLR